MNKFIVILLLVPLFTHARGGYIGPGVKYAISENPTTTVAEVKQMSDGSVVSLTGYIIKALGHEMYLFKTNDSDDTIELEVDLEGWEGIISDETTLLTIVGEVDSDWGSTYIEVDYLTLAK
ncbi:YgiW/YdeI family stress tolerance OB fold protein [Vibrio sp. T20]|uniref:YgiW/YdeI family stress tolerance OB fold protein n=1 Tax=Vibrio sp. T20 TaxID=2588450 RepID=UPI0011B45FFE|nr:NirD/YgiW/YdeI family stress tolerance protein [Vibrio sp. T20]